MTWVTDELGDCMQQMEAVDSSIAQTVTAFARFRDQSRL